MSKPEETVPKHEVLAQDVTGTCLQADKCYVVLDERFLCDEEFLLIEVDGRPMLFKAKRFKIFAF